MASTLSVKELGNTSGPPLFFLAGWPDPHSIWDTVVARFQSEFRCIVACSPDYDRYSPSRPWAYSFSECAALLEATIDEHTKADEKVRFVLHDWGCLWGILYATRRPEKILRMVLLDVGANSNDDNTDPPQVPEVLWMLFYQSYFACTYAVGSTIKAATGSHKIASAVGNGMLWPFLRGFPLWGFQGFSTPQLSRPWQEIRWWMQYPYYYMLRGLITGEINRNKVFIPPPKCPIFFIHGKNKRAQFHSPQFCDMLNARKDGSKAVAFDASHWIMLDKPEELIAAIKPFINASDLPPSKL